MVIVDFYNLLEIGFLDLVWSRGELQHYNFRGFRTIFDLAFFFPFFF